MNRLWQMAFVIFVCVPVIASGAEFKSSYYELLLKQHINTGVAINGIQLNAVDYTALVQEVKQPNSDYSLLLKERASFDTASLKSREEKIAFPLDDHHTFITGKQMLVCGNSAAMIGETRFGKHFKISGDRSVHFGPFDCLPAASKEAVGDPCSGGSCC